MKLYMLMLYLLCKFIFNVFSMYVVAADVRAEPDTCSHSEHYARVGTSGVPVRSSRYTASVRHRASAAAIHEPLGGLY